MAHADAVLGQLATRRYSLRFPTAGQIFASLLDGSCDVGFVYMPVVSSRLVTADVWEEELVLIVPARGAPHRLPCTVDAFAGISFVTYDESEYVFGKWFEMTFRRRPRALQSAYHLESRPTRHRAGARAPRRARRDRAGVR